MSLELVVTADIIGTGHAHRIHLRTCPQAGPVSMALDDHETAIALTNSAALHSTWCPDCSRAVGARKPQAQTPPRRIGRLERALNHAAAS